MGTPRGGEARSSLRVGQTWRQGDWALTRSVQALQGGGREHGAGPQAPVSRLQWPRCRLSSRCRETLGKGLEPTRAVVSPVSGMEHTGGPTAGAAPPGSSDPRPAGPHAPRMALKHKFVNFLRAL